MQPWSGWRLAAVSCLNGWVLGGSCLQRNAFRRLACRRLARGTALAGDEGQHIGHVAVDDHLGLRIKAGRLQVDDNQPRAWV